MTITLFLYLLFFQVPAAVPDPKGQPADGGQVACGSETKTSDAHQASDFPSVCKTSDRVVVTATRAPLAAEESGVAADVFTAKDFEPARGSFVQNLLRDVPGLSVVQTGRNGGLTSVFTRGGESDSALEDCSEEAILRRSGLGVAPGPSRRGPDLASTRGRFPAASGTHTETWASCTRPHSS